MKRLLMISLVLVLATGCKGKTSTGSAASQNNPSAAAPSAGPIGGSASTVVARINGQDVTDAELYQRVEKRLKRLESQVFDIKRSGLDDLIEEKLLDAEAKKRGITIDAVLKAEVDDKIQPPSDQEIQTYYNLFKQRFNNQPLEQIKPQVTQQIQATRRSSLYGDFIAGLEKGNKIEVLMERPRIEVSVDDDPSKGDKNAAVTIIEFSEFQCPFCKRARPTVDQILNTYKGKVRYVFRDFPLSFHQLAQKASEAANCAGDQNKYWEYNANLWEKQPNIQPDQLKGYAKDLGLNTKKFNECLDSGKFAAEIQKDIQDGSAAGVSGTPAYFVNGIFISGAQPFENFKQIIDEELKRAGK